MARAAGADSVIDKAPYGLDTLVASSNWGGTDLSGGQWQRIAVARAFYRDAAVLMLDEPTSAMAPRAEHLVIRRFRNSPQARPPCSSPTITSTSTRTASTVFFLLSWSSAFCRTGPGPCVRSGVMRRGAVVPG